ncbi:MAG: AAA domain-containing protein, partial [Actinomycetota bacterium]
MLALEEHGLSGMLAAAAEGAVPHTELVKAVERAVLTGWVDEVLVSDPRLHPIRPDERAAVLAEFVELDTKLGPDAAARVIEACNRSRPRTRVGGAGIIEREAQKKRRHMPVRALLAATVDTAAALKPCFMMSPLSVSQFLPADWRFDVVIFDEASQIPPPDAINCIYRGQQLIVAGDERQLPPTSFFDTADEEEDGYDEEQFDTFESVLGL